MFPIFAGNSASTGYNLTRSLRFRASASASLSRTPASAGNRKTWTWSSWVKRGTLSTAGNIFTSLYSAADNFLFRFLDDNTIQIANTTASTATLNLITTQVFRDPSAWYHIVLSIDTTQATSSNRASLYVNGNKVSAFSLSTYPSLNADLNINQTNAHNISNLSGNAQYFDGYLTEVNFIDGQALTPSSFGSTNALTGVWQPASFTGTYGTNGFILDFKNPTSALTLGYDAVPATRITSGSGTYTIPAYSSSLVIECWGAGGGGAGTTNGSVAATAGTGGTTTFGTLIATGGVGGTGAQDNVVNGTSGVGGTATGGDVNTTGNTGTTNYYTGYLSGANGVGGGGLGGLVNVAASTVGPSGGGGSGGAASTAAGGAGGSGGYTKKTYAPGAISGSISYAVGTGGTAGAGSSFSGNAGANGAIRITVDGVRVDNDWYARNISVAAGVTYDSMTDVPTLTSATAANFCTWNPVAQSTVVNGTVTRSNGNLTSTDGGTTYGLASIGTIASTTGKFYWEVTLSAAGDVYANIGVVDLNLPLGAGVHTGLLYAQNGTKNSGSNVFATGGGGAAYGASYTVGDVIGVALDLTAGTITFYKNGTSQGVAYTGISGNYTPAVGDGQNTTSYTFNLNCGQRPFAYTPPTGFVALNTFNLPTSTIIKGNTVMDATLYTGTGSALTITNAAPFKPDLVWIKVRSNAISHALTDSVRGISSILSSDLTSAQATQSAGQGLTAFNSNGFSLGTQSAGASDTNFSGRTYVGWQWQAGQGSSSSNTNGTITSTVSVNASAGFSVATFTCPASGNFTVGHGLGVAPVMFIAKSRSTGNWVVYHQYMTSTPQSTFMQLNTTLVATSNTSIWANTLPTSSVVSYGTNSAFNPSDTAVMYAWTPIAGFSAFGSYTGNGSTDGVFVFTPFRPKFVIIKRTDAVGDWYTFDSVRDPYNATQQGLSPNSSASETTYTGWGDLLSNGFKIRRTDAAWNASGGTYIYMAFAENPFKNSLAR